MATTMFDIDRLIALDRVSIRLQLLVAAALIGAGVVAMTVLAKRAAGSGGLTWDGVGLVALIVGVFLLNLCLGRWERIAALRSAQRNPELITDQRGERIVSTLYSDLLGVR